MIDVGPFVVIVMVVVGCVCSMLAIAVLESIAWLRRQLGLDDEFDTNRNRSDASGYGMLIIGIPFFIGACGALAVIMASLGEP